MLETILGTAEMILASDRHVGELIDGVTSPGGTTSRALHVLHQGRFSAVLTDAIDAAYRRTVEMGTKLDEQVQGAEGPGGDRRASGGQGPGRSTWSVSQSAQAPINPTPFPLSHPSPRGEGNAIKDFWDAANLPLLPVWDAWEVRDDEGLRVSDAAQAYQLTAAPGRSPRRSPRDRARTRRVEAPEQRLDARPARRLHVAGAVDGERAVLIEQHHVLVGRRGPLRTGVGDRSGEGQRARLGPHVDQHRRVRRP